MKQSVLVRFAYPLYFLLILGQYFLGEGLDLLSEAPKGSKMYESSRQSLADARESEDTESLPADKIPYQQTDLAAIKSWRVTDR